MGAYLDRLERCKQILKDAPLERSLWQDAERWAEGILPSRQKKLTPQQRASRARFLRALRRETHHGDLSAYTESCAARLAQSAQWDILRASMRGSGRGSSRTK